MSNLSWLNPTPHATAVYASCSALLPPHATLASRRPATALPGPDLHRLIAPALAGAFSFNHLIGDGEQGGRHLDPEDACRLHIDDELKLGRPHYRQVGGLFALEDAPGINAGLTNLVQKVWAVAHQSADFCELAFRIYCGQVVVGRQMCQLQTTDDEATEAIDPECINAFLCKARKGGVNLAIVGCRDDLDGDSKCRSRRPETV